MRIKKCVDHFQTLSKQQSLSLSHSSPFTCPTQIRPWAQNTLNSIVVNTASSSLSPQTFQPKKLYCFSRFFSVALLYELFIFVYLVYSGKWVLLTFPDFGFLLLHCAELLNRTLHCALFSDTRWQERSSKEERKRLRRIGVLCARMEGS